MFVSPAMSANFLGENHPAIKERVLIKAEAEPAPIQKRAKAAIQTLLVKENKHALAAHKRQEKVISFLDPILSKIRPQGICKGV
jgi:hypothetical protein